MTSRRFWAVAVAIVAAAAIAACSPAPAIPVTGTQPPSGFPVTPSASPSPAPSASPEPPEPMTGLPGTQTGSAVVVPIDVGSGKPGPTGLADADIVSLEFAEHGSIRLAAMFQSRYPTRVGPLGGLRPSDLKLFDTANPVIAQTGSTTGFLSTAKSFGLSVRTAGVGTGFTSAGGTYYADPEILRTGAKGVPNPMFEYAQSGSALSRVDVSTATKIVISAPGHAAVTWTLDSATDTWHTVIGGVTMTTTNLVIMVTPYSAKVDSKSGQSLSFPNPQGTGKAVVAAADSVINATWDKRTYDYALNLLGPDQDTPQLTAGPTWIVLAPTGSKVTTS